MRHDFKLSLIGFLLLAFSHLVSALEIGAGIVVCDATGRFQVCDQGYAVHLYVQQPLYQGEHFGAFISGDHISHPEPEDLHRTEPGSGYFNSIGIYTRYRF